MGCLMMKVPLCFIFSGSVHIVCIQLTAQVQKAKRAALSAVVEAKETDSEAITLLKHLDGAVLFYYWFNMIEHDLYTYECHIVIVTYNN